VFLVVDIELIVFVVVVVFVVVDSRYRFVD